MNYIINPFYIYLYNLLPQIRVLMTVIGVISCVGLLFGWLVYSAEVGTSDKECTELFKKIKGFIITGLIIFVLAFFIPTKETIVEMIVAKYATVENVEAAGGMAKNTIDYIFEKIDELND